MEEKPLIPDFINYPEEKKIISVKKLDIGVEILWDDNVVDYYHYFWLRENCPGPETTHPDTREQTLKLLDLPDDLRALDVYLDDKKRLNIYWQGEHKSCYHSGWLRAHGKASEVFSLPSKKLWGRKEMDKRPVFNGHLILKGDQNELLQWILAIHEYGFGILQNIPLEKEMIKTIVKKIGPLRESNFGDIFDVELKAELNSNAYTNMGLPLHTDLATREYVPGLQILHCMKNDTGGGETLLSDGFHVAKKLEKSDPLFYQALTRESTWFVNKDKKESFRFKSPVIKLEEVRISPWLRGKVEGSLEEVDIFYKAFRKYLTLTQKKDNFIQFPLLEGELICFDNRRVLHGRTEIGSAKGTRWLRGCYAEREDLISRLRILQRG
ncbi:MAG: TauD/TfdA family dioxygenase [Bdellovibrionota bacterium]|nr:TauD/TfdA family dioxygenase [Bdellovibrionota bacterium]